MSVEAVKAILVELGVEEAQLGPDRHLRADLALDSTETTELEIELRHRFNVAIDLWDRTDYTIAELAQRVAVGGDGPARPGGAATGAEPVARTGGVCA